MRTILRTKRFHNPKSLVRLFKCHILSFLEGATPAIYHAASSVLKPLDDLLQHFLDELDISSRDALLDFNLAPLQMRRDIAMLGILYKVAWNKAPRPIQNLFSLRLATLREHGFNSNVARHNKQIMDPVAFYHPVIVKRSISASTVGSVSLGSLCKVSNTRSNNCS